MDKTESANCSTGLVAAFLSRTPPLITKGGNPATRAELAAHYDALLAPFAVGDYGLAEPEVGETRLAVRRRLQAAAGRRGWVLDFVLAEGGGLVFHVQPGG